MLSSLHVAAFRDAVPRVERENFLGRLPVPALLFVVRSKVDIVHIFGGMVKNEVFTLPRLLQRFLKPG